LQAEAAEALREEQTVQAEEELVGFCLEVSMLLLELIILFL
jgi:hypothetical protein